MTKEHIENVKEIIKLSKEEKKQLKKSGVIYSLFSFAEISATFAFSCLKMPLEAVACGVSSVACALGVLYFKIEEKEVEKEIKAFEEKVKGLEK